MLWVKSFHLLAVIAWLVGIFYLPRIFVHYVEGRAAGEDVRRLVVMARRLFGFMTVMAAAAVVLGLVLWWVFHDTGRWLMFKLIFVIALIGYHWACHALLHRMESGAVLPRSVWLRCFNEAALLLVVPIIVLAVVKPF